MGTLLIIFFLLLAVGYYAARALLWWIQRTVERHMQDIDSYQEPTQDGSASSPTRKRPIGDREGEYVEYEDVKDEPK